MDQMTEQILRRRMHGLYLSRKCEDIRQLSQELLGLHCWFHRNVAFSALIRGTELSDWKTALTKTWLYRGTLHGVVFEDLPLLLALHSEETNYDWLGVSEEQMIDISEKVISYMEDGVYSRTEMRQLFAMDFDESILKMIFSSWGGIFVYLARIGKVAFRDMTSRDFDLIDAEPTQSSKEVLPELLHRFFATYGPATLDDAAWFFGLYKSRRRKLDEMDFYEYAQFEYEGKIYYYVEDGADMGDIPELTLLSGFDPLIVSYAERSAVLPPEYKSRVVTKSGICLPTIAINGTVAGLWNIKKGQPMVEFFEAPSKRIQNTALELVETIRWETMGVI